MLINPYNFTRPVTNPNMFFGRTELVEKLMQGLTSDAPSSFAVYGGRRMGKTSLMRMLEHQLNHRLDAATQPIVVPLYVDFQFYPPQSPAEFFQRLLGRLLEWQESTIGEIDPLPPVREDAPAPSFAVAFLELFRRAHPKLGGIKLALLLDESEKLQRAPWAHDLDDNLRALLTNVPGVTGHLGLVLAGATDLYTDMVADHFGSPLRNVLDEEIKMSACSSEEMLRLIQEPTNNQVPANAVDEVIRQAGGHLFMGQFLMHHLWNEHWEQATVELVQETAAEFPEKRRDFERWLEALGETGMRVYAEIIQHDYPLSRTQLNNLPDLDFLSVSSALDSLIFHGLITGERRQYTWSGEMFRSWFLNNVMPSITSSSVSQPKTVDSTVLIEKIVDHFSESELQELCLELMVDYETLGGPGKRDRARELVSYLKRRGREAELVETCQRLRPHVSW